MCSNATGCYEPVPPKETVTRWKPSEVSMPVRDMQRYAELVRSGAGEAERIELLKKHREEVRRALASQRECLKLLDAKIEYYADCLTRAPQANAL